ncbi:carbohydrate ABC transporter substrate-binding protein (CUT1 family) [Isoptericola sp. CG 20/1183]|uniref:Carbohydrate ABC transporter substrate-binding protein (CUT1 family) n=1 Tax=Isoptericola halotolerans TaxID=300560 RepID=A0ABX5EF82_9MICO|nr:MULTISPECIES: extracellular solute-binding protein [Isoptericola]MCK0117360.1 extracellular solute-binding protein [Isoptericola sp. S6320L]PRZ07658.1 carbohydrate ABC transporter substrate-binding protein (CUT1 family) [Isoptericola halotolerans]PRZ07983.1 carbohydrate ABC transporter substrate-binding protein (CUT1 family) [Isoptericola sp. CG 20/1183]
MIRRRAAALTAALALAPVLSACGPEEVVPESSDDIVLWLVGADTGDDLRSFLVETFEERNPGATLTIEQKEWPTLVEDLEASLGDPAATPDVVELGNTQAPTFTGDGAFREISPELYEELGGDDLLQSFVEAGSVDGTVYALPYYFGSRYVFYRKDVWEAAGAEVPKTLDEFGETVKALRDGNQAGFAMGGQDWRNGISWVFAHGGELAVKEGGAWVSTLSDPDTVAGLEAWQDIYQNASYLPATEVDVAYWDFLNDGVGGGEPAAATIMAPSWARWSIGDLVRDENNEEVRDGMADTDRFGIFALPGVDGGVAPVFAGGSNMAVSALTRNADLSEDLLRIVYSDDYQTMLAESGLGPANTEFTELMAGDKFGRTLVATAEASKLTPPAPGWADIESRGIYEELFKEIARGGSVPALAEKYDGIMTPMLDGDVEDE